MNSFDKVISLIIVLVVGTLVFNSCHNDSTEPAKPKTGTVYMPQAQHNPVQITLTNDSPGAAVNYSAGIEGNAAKSDITVHFNVDSSLVDTYNSAHSTSLLLLPQDNYKLDKQKETILAGDKEGLPLILIISGNQPFLHKEQNYLLPVTVSTQSDGVKANKKLQTIYFVIQNNVVIGTGKPSGRGTKAAPYKIASLDNLKWISAHPLSWGGMFVQTQDIDASKTQTWNNGKGFSPIGNHTGTSFTGTYDGQGHTIKGIYINRPQQDYEGFFGVTNENTVISNVHLTEVDITGGKDSGGLIGLNYGKVDDSEVSSSQGQIKSNTKNIGGLIGSNHGIIKGSQANIKVSADGAHVGGLIGFSEDGKISDSHAAGDVQSKGKEVGGLIGDNHDPIDNSYATGDVQSGGKYSGGLVGLNYADINKSYAAGDISGDYDVGGLVGDNHGEIANSHATGDIVSSGGYNGGLLGYTIGSVKNCYAAGDVHDKGGKAVGGLVGYAKTGKIETSFATGNVQTDGKWAGGLVGNTHVSISNTYATGNAKAGGTYAGGLVGRITTSGVILSNSYAIGKAAANGGKDPGGGVLGSIGTATTKNLYWDTETSGLSGSAAGTGLKTSKMQGTAAKANMDGLDFSKVWQVQNGEYPILRDNQPQGSQ
jgi:hypothetical protein